MPFFDWVELCGCHPENFKGSCSVTVGDALSGYFGARHTHIFGPEIKMVCDLEDMTLGQLDECIPLVSALALGVGGNVTWVYGSNTTATYVGPKMEIRRAKSITKTSKHVVARVGPDPDESEESDESESQEPAPIDKATCAAVTVLSVLLAGVSAALELAIHFQYNEMQSTKDNDDLSEEQKEQKCEGYEETIENLKIISYTVSGRLMALLKTIEHKGSWSEFGKKWLEDVEKAGKAIAKAFEEMPGDAYFCAMGFGYESYAFMKAAYAARQAIE